jgi:hypothetical protein
MAISEIDRVALYWPGRAIQKLRNERQGGHRRTSKNRPFAETEILEGGCKLYRVFHVANASSSTWEAAERCLAKRLWMSPELASIRGRGVGNTITAEIRD